MLRRVRQLRISLAAKCQLLFGAAVVMIIGAALFVPWHRIEQLTEQLNERAAGALAEYAVSAHVASAGPQTRPSSNGASPSPGTRLVPLSLPQDPRQFEFQAQGHFKRHPDAMALSEYYERDDGTKGYRYAQPLFYKDQLCAQCHWAVDVVRVGAERPATQPQSQPTTFPTTVAAAARTPLRVDRSNNRAGVVSVDIGSRIDTTELLLNRVFVLGAGGLAGSLAIITFYIITTRLILHPVRVLQETAEKVSQGDLNIRSDIATGDEFQQLSETFNVMLANLKQSTDQLRSVNKSLDLKLGQLAETNVALYESNRLKSEFLANVSHELRTPLNSILGFAELLKDALAAPADARTSRYIHNIVRSGRNLLELINDLLDLAKIEAGRMEVRSEPLSLGDLFEALTTLLKPLAEQKGLRIVASIAPEVPIIRSDPGKLQQVLYNFLSNAIKFSPDGAAIDLTADLIDAPEHARIRVTDRGPGIDPTQHGMIFEKFRQVDGSVTRTHSGTGLGLAISKELTALMGGSIGVISSPGEGATFWVVLPLKVEAGQMDVRRNLVMT